MLSGTLDCTIGALTRAQARNMKRFLDTNQVASRFRVRPQTLLRWVKEGRFPKPIKCFGWYRWEENQLDGVFGQPELQKIAVNAIKR